MSTTSPSMPPNHITNNNPPDPTSIYANVQTHYTSAAKSTHDGSTSSNNYAHTVASAFGYSSEELMRAPSEANLGLSCGNPFAVAKIREGETVVDLGCGAGFDVFQAAKKVGGVGEGEGRVVGVDMNKEMLARAEKIKENINARNVSFVESPITKIDLPDQSADCIISNCVINLIPAAEKQLAFHEMFRLLKPKGRVAISDILLKQDLPDELKSNMALYVGCVAGASRVEAYRQYLSEAGFKDILIVADQSDLNVYKSADKDDSGTKVGCCGPGSAKKSTCCSGGDGVVGEKEDAEGKDVDFNEWAGSFKIYAVKPAA